MAFVNEYVSKEDIEKYGLDELYEKYMRLTGHIWDENVLPNTVDWSLDRERESWFIKVGSYLDSEHDNHRTTGEYIYILYFKGETIEVHIRRNAKRSSLKLSDNPFRQNWEILSISPKLPKNTNKEEIIGLIRDALVSYGYAGKRKQLPNVVAEVKYVGDK